MTRESVAGEARYSFSATWGRCFATTTVTSSRRRLKSLYRIAAIAVGEYRRLGLGLSIVRHIVELHGGKAQAWSAGAGHGATFSVFLPVHSTRERASANA